MMKFLDEDFLLRSELSRRLYHGYAEKLPIFDYHTHIPVRDIAEDRKYRNIAEILVDTPVARRLMRMGGAPEVCVAGRGSAEERFRQFARILPDAAGSLAYVWVHRVLRRCFDCELVLSPETADEIWRHCNGKLVQPTYTTKQILARGGMECVITSDDAAADLAHHRRIQKEGAPFRVLPAMHFGATMAVEDYDWANYIAYQLGQAADVEITTMADVRTAIARQMDAFGAVGCVTADLPLAELHYVPAEESELDDLVGRVVTGGGEATRADGDAFRTAILRYVGKECALRGWVLQIHYGIVRGTNKWMRTRYGQDAAFDCLGEAEGGRDFAELLNALATDESLPKLLATSMNPAGQNVLGSVLGSFRRQGSVNLQQGFAWVDIHARRSLSAQLESFAGLGILGRILAPASESHTPVSWPRHAFYRRILCDFLAGLVEEGLYPADEEALGRIVRNICYENIRALFQPKGQKA